MTDSKDRELAPRHQPLSPGSIGWAGLGAACVLTWAVTFVSLTHGRTTPWTLSREWLLFFGIQVAAALSWGLAASWLFDRIAGPRPRMMATPARRAAFLLFPLGLSLPALAAIYLSDQSFHFLSSNPIPRAFVQWGPVTAMAVWQEALLIWRLRPGRWVWNPGAMPLSVFAFFLALYVFTSGGHLYSPDESQMFFVSQNLADRGSVAIPRDEQEIAAGREAVWYSKYGLVPSLIAAVPYKVATMVGWEAEAPSAAFPIPNGAPPLMGLSVGPLITAATCAVLFALAVEIGFGQLASLVVVLAYGLTTSAWVYSKSLFSQPPATLFFLTAIYLLLRRGGSPVRNHILAGLLLGLAWGSRAEMALLGLPVFAMPFLRRSPGARSSTGLGLTFASVALVSGGLLVGWYNYVKTGSVLMTGHGGQGTLAGFSQEPFIGLFGILASPGFSFFLYNPVAMLGIAALPILAVRRPRIAYLIAGISGLAILFYGSFGDWFAGFTWASRYLVVILPLAVLPIGMLLQRPWRSPLAVASLAGSMALGFAINGLGVIFDFNSGWLDLWAHGANLDLILWDPHYSPILAHVRLLHDFFYTGSKLDLYIYYKLGAPALVVFLLLAASLLALALRTAWLLDRERPFPAITTAPGTIGGGKQALGNSDATAHRLGSIEA